VSLDSSSKWKYSKWGVTTQMVFATALKQCFVTDRGRFRDASLILCAIQKCMTNYRRLHKDQK